jgi:carbamoyltransferase
LIVLGLSGLPNGQAFHLQSHPHAREIDRRICQGMDSAACIVVDGEVRAAAAEERFTGAKGTGVFPAQAIRYCLDHAGIGSDDVDVIAHGFNYDKYRRFFHHTPDYFHQALSGQTMIDALTSDGWRDVAARFRPVDHHLAHAASACQLSGFEDSLSIVSDGMGEIHSLSVHRYTRGEFRQLHSQRLKTSLGLLYSIVTRFLGYTFNSDEYKVMGLSAYGDPARFAAFFERFMRHEDGAIAVDWPLGALERGGAGYPDAMDFLEHSLGVPARAPGAEVAAAYADIAAAFQRRFSVILTELARWWLVRTGADSLCLSGGTFLNCLANESIGRLPQVGRMFVPPGAGDDGTAVGSALYVTERPASGFSVYTGPGYQPADVSKALANFPQSGRTPPACRYHGFSADYFDLAARDLARDGIIGWFAGRMEFGPRALGNRSILALPNGVDVKNRLNKVVKLRESFRPFAPAILAEDYAEIFDGRPLDPTRYMLCTARVRPEQAHRISGAVHVDGSARVQIVYREENEHFWRLLRRVKHHTGLGCVINTSFNVKNQPIIMTPELALEGFATMSLDRLYIEGFQIGGDTTGADSAV